MSQFRYHCAAFGCGCPSMVRKYPSYLSLRELHPDFLEEVRREAERIGGFIKDCDEEPKECVKVNCKATGV